jgi:hypothetical protein
MAFAGLIVLLDVTAKKATTRSPSVLVVMDGAANDVFVGVNAPPWESTGADTSTPSTSRIAPAADTVDVSVHV